MWPLYSFVGPKWQLWDDFVAIARGRVGDNKFARPRGVDLAIFIGGKIAFFSPGPSSSPRSSFPSGRCCSSTGSSPRSRASP